MKFRAFALGAAVTAAASGLIPATAMAATAGTVTGPSGTPASSSASSGAGASAAASNKSNVNVEVITQLPRDYYWHDQMIYDHGREVALPAGYSYKDRGIVSPSDRFYFAPDGTNSRDGIIVAPMQCQDGRYNTAPVKASNWIGKIVDGALKACANVYDVAYGIISDAAGTGSASGYGGTC